jgi:hypothetical protein
MNRWTWTLNLGQETMILPMLCHRKEKGLELGVVCKAPDLGDETDTNLFHK